MVSLSLCVCVCVTITLFHLALSFSYLSLSLSPVVTTCGSESNLHGILLGRETQAARGNDNAVLYASRESHYSIFKAARYFRMNAEPISTLPTGEIDLDALAEAVTRNMDGTECRKGVVLNINVGTTVKGAVDSLGGALKVLDVLGVAREDRFVHCDGALFALMLPFLDEDAIPADKAVSFLKDIDSMSVSGHKMLGCKSS